MNLKFLCCSFVCALGFLTLVAWTAPAEMEFFNSHLDEQEEIIRERIPNVVTIVSPIYNPAVRSYLNTYIYRRPAQTAEMLGWAAYYFPKFEEVLKEEGLPTDLKYLAIVESALNPNAISRSGAGGLWQFMKPTARECGLKCGSYIDERMDPEKSSKAAATYLKQLYAMFGNWELVMAAYNAGPGRVRSAVKRAGTSNYWELARFLPEETRSYVPGFIAASYIMNYHYEHNIIAEYPEHACGELTSVMVYESMSLADLATKSGMTVEMVKGLNPAFVRNIIPSSQTGHVIWLPDSAAELFNSGRIVVPPVVFVNEFANADTRTAIIHGKNYKISTIRKTYIVRSGDNLYDLAKKNNCTVSELMIWNKMHSSRLAIGQKLEIRKEMAELMPLIVEEAPPALPVRSEQSIVVVPSLGMESLFYKKKMASLEFNIEPSLQDQTSNILVLKRRQSLMQALSSSPLNSSLQASQIIIPANAMTGDVVRVKSKA